MSEAASTFNSGFLGTVGLTVGGSKFEFPTIRWDVNPTARLAEIMNSRSGAYVRHFVTFKDLTGSFAVDHDFTATQSPYAQCKVGDTVGPLYLYLTQTVSGAMDGVHWTINSAVISGAPQRLEVAGAIGTSFNFAQADGNITWPS
jgi:hypothetical protein